MAAPPRHYRRSRHDRAQTQPGRSRKRRITYEELEPHYDQFEYLCGTSGTAGNLNGKIQDGGNPFEGSRTRPYPTPAMKQGYGHVLFAQAAKELGYKP
jgi:gluconate 2-dehydrogenase alpha chain